MLAALRPPSRSRRGGCRARGGMKPAGERVDIDNDGVKLVAAKKKLFKAVAEAANVGISIPVAAAGMRPLTSSSTNDEGWLRSPIIAPAKIFKPD